MLPSRTQPFVNALVSEKGKTSQQEKQPLGDDAIIILCGVRTAQTKAKRGGLKDLHADELLAAVLKNLIKRVPKIPMSEFGELMVGNCLQPGGGQAMSRMAAFEAGLPYTLPVAALNRQCSSGLQTIASVAGGLLQGSYNVGIAAGVESMSTCAFDGATPIVNWSAVRENHLASQCMIPMGITSERISHRYGITRSEQDKYAVESHHRAANAVKLGEFNNEIIIVNGVTSDDSIRDDCNIKSLSKLKPAFKKGGSTTAGNSSPLSDGASAVIITTEKYRKKLYNNFPPMDSILCVWKNYVVVGVPPDIMGVGPAYAIPALLSQANLTLSDIDVFEINEAFASQIIFTINFLGLDKNKVNPNGGALALGHPLGCSGNRLVVTCANYMKRKGLRYGIVSLCVGTGMGAAALIENPAFYLQTPTRSHL